MDEVWKPVEGAEGYEVSNLGRARTLDRKIVYKDGRIATFKGKDLSVFRGAYGYPAIYLPGGKRKHVHRLVADAFLPRKEGCDVINHINGDKFDNRVENLEWSTASENNRHARATGLQNQHGENCNLTRYSEQIVQAVRRVHAKYGSSYRDLAVLFDMSEMQAADIVKGRTRAKA